MTPLLATQMKTYMRTLRVIRHVRHSNGPQALTLVSAIDCKQFCVLVINGLYPQQGFSNASKTWLPLAPDYQTLNVDVESSSANSHLKIYKSLIALRKRSKTLQNGSYKYKALANNFFALKRYTAVYKIMPIRLLYTFTHFNSFLAGEDTVVYIANLGNDTSTVDLQNDFDTVLPDAMSLTISSLYSTKISGCVQLI